MTVSEGTWRWRVVTVDGYSVVESPPDGPVLVGIPPLTFPAAPQNFTATALGIEQNVSLAWTKPVEDPGNPPADRFQIRHREQNTDTWTETAELFADPSTVGSTSINETAAAGNVWEYSVRFINDTGPGPWAESAFVDFTTDSYWATESGGGWLTESGGLWLTEDQT